MTHVLIVDDEPAICWAFKECLSDEGFTVDVAGSAEQALEISDRRTPDVVVMDIRLPGMDGIAALQKLQTKMSSTPVIIMTAFGSLSTAVKAIDGGAFDYLTKPIDLEKAVAVVRQAVNAAQSASGTPVADDTSHNDELIIGSSPAMQEVFRRIALVAERDVPVLITGESGTGKDLVARAIHQHSRRKGSFVPVCIPALSESVVESELFGHARGAFTGADQERKGLLELANQGTAFIDEIGDVPLNVQVKLLRTLETHEVRPVGSGTCRTASFRMIAATNRQLEQRVAEGEFRHDLFFRLNVFRIEIPPLRDRVEDIRPLVQRFLQNSRSSGHPLSISDAAMVELESRAWHGNVRELRNVIESATVVCRGDFIQPEHLPQPVTSLNSDRIAAPDVRPANSSAALAEVAREWMLEQVRTADADVRDLYEKFLQTVEPELITIALQSTNGHRGSAARLLGMHRETLREKLKRMGEDQSTD